MGETNEMLKMIRAEIEQAERRATERALGRVISALRAMVDEGDARDGVFERLFLEKLVDAYDYERSR